MVEELQKTKVQYQRKTYPLKLKLNQGQKEKIDSFLEEYQKVTNFVIKKCTQEIFPLYKKNPTPITKKCPLCGSSKTKKKGFRSGVQRYICNTCSKGFTLSRRPSKLRSILWNDFVFNRHTIKQLSTKHRRSIDWIRKELRAYEPPPPTITPRAMVAVMDCVFFGRTSGYLVVRDPHRKENVYWSQIERETLYEYQCAVIR